MTKAAFEKIAEGLREAIDLVSDPDARIYPCSDCGKLRSKSEGGTTFTVCDECWDKHFGKINTKTK